MDDILDIIDENGNELGFTKLKSKAHKDGDWHRGAHLWIIKDSKILLQKRSPNKNFFPNCFDVACGGHVSSGETYEETIVREVKEELGLEIKKEELVFIEKRKQVSVMKESNLISREILEVYLFRFNGDINDLKLKADEVSEIRLFDPSELLEMMKTKPEMFVDDEQYFFEIIHKIKAMMSDSLHC